MRFAPLPAHRRLVDCAEPLAGGPTPRLSPFPAAVPFATQRRGRGQGCQSGPLVHAAPIGTVLLASPVSVEPAPSSASCPTDCRKQRACRPGSTTAPFLGRL